MNFDELVTEKRMYEYDRSIFSCILSYKNIKGYACGERGARRDLQQRRSAQSFDIGRKGNPCFMNINAGDKAAMNMVKNYALAQTLFCSIGKKNRCAMN